MSLTYPIPRGTREITLTSAPGQVLFGPIDFMLYDALDIELRTVAPGDTHAVLVDPTGYAVAPAAPATSFPAKFTVTLNVARPSGTIIGLRGTRVPARSTDVTRGGVLQSQRIEVELDKMTAVDQELRRDIGRALLADPFANAIDAQGIRLINVGSPIEGGDAATKEWALSAGGSFVAQAQAAVAAAQAIADGILPGTVLDGAVVDAKVAVGADIQGSKLADASIPTAKLQNDAVTADKLAENAVVNANVADGAAIDAAKLSWSAPYAGSQARSVVSVLADYSHSVFNIPGLQTALGAGQNVVPFLDALSSKTRSFFFPPGNYRFDSQWVAPDRPIIEGAHKDLSIITRGGPSNGAWSGHTIQAGTSGSYECQVRNLSMIMPHPDWTADATTNLLNRCIGGQAHLKILNGRHQIIENLYMEGCQFGLDMEGAAYSEIRGCEAIGHWDYVHGGLQEMRAGFYFRGTTKPNFRGNRVSGYHSPFRTKTVNAYVNNSWRDEAGPQNGVLIESSEWFTASENYIGACSEHGFFCNPNGGPLGTNNIIISNNHFDGARLSQIAFGSQGAGWTTFGIAIIGNAFAGQAVTENAIRVYNTIGAPVAIQMAITGNIGQAWTYTPMRLLAAKGVMVGNNMLTGFHYYGWAPGSPEAAAGAYVDQVSDEVHFGPNFWGGSINALSPDSHQQWGPYKVGGGNVTGAIQRGVLATAVVGGFSQSSP